MKVRLAACAAALLLVLLPSGAGAQPQGELRIAIPWTPENLDPTMNLAAAIAPPASMVTRDASASHIRGRT